MKCLKKFVDGFKVLWRLDGVGRLKGFQRAFFFGLQSDQVWEVIRVGK